MSLAIKRSCPFALPIHQYNDPRTLLTMDSYTPRYINRNGLPEWEPLSPITIPEEIYKDTLQRSPSPPKRARNAKNLSLNVPSGSINNISTASAPASPFRSPRLPGKRPPNLTINVHSLHRHPSTPELYTSNIGSPIVASPGPYTSKRFPTLNIDTRHIDTERSRARHTDPTVSSTVPYEESIEREKAYPDGPRLIIKPNIWLYAEPDLALAKTYEVVVNVAREVGNPFIVPEVSRGSFLSPRSDSVASTPSLFSPSSSIISNPSPSLPSSNSSGTSPQLPLRTNESSAPMSYKYNDVEYMHIPWDHNSTLSQDLPGIVDHILERAEQGKKILVHCQVSPQNGVKSLLIN
jgi:tyrosine-protein phosphatase MSG5